MVILVYIVVIALAFFLLIVLPQRRRSVAHRALLESLLVGDDVVTIGGMLGTVRELDDERVQLEVADGVVLTFARSAIAQNLTQQPSPTGDSAGDSADDSTGTATDDSTDGSTDGSTGTATEA